METAPDQIRMISMGFWLPCNQSLFFTHSNNDPSSEESHSIDLEEIVRSHRIPSDSDNSLNNTVFRRLLAVLPRKQYTHIYPIFENKKMHKDPIGAVFTASGSEVFWPEAVKPRTVVFIVDSSGFYLWLAVYDSEHAASNSEAAQHAALRQHIYDIVGGGLYSHEPETLQEYRDGFHGILTFNQINTILEGLNSSTLDPDVFFASESSQGDVNRVEETKKKYSIGSFIGKILAEFNVEDALAKREVGKEGDPNLTPSQWRKELTKKISATPFPSDEIYEALMHKATYSRLLQVFLRTATDETLQKMKSRIERCRRALLSQMIEITHRRDPFTQVEPPPNDNGVGIEGVNETQLRGYVMLLAAKLPLISNVDVFVEDIYEAQSFPKTRHAATMDAEAVKEHSAIRIAYSAWRILLISLNNDIKGLGSAINQAQEDKQLYEAEQIRREEETFTEIERLRLKEEDEIEPFISGAGLSHFSLAISIFASLLTVYSLDQLIKSFSIYTIFLVLGVPFVVLALFVGLAFLYRFIFTELGRFLTPRIKRFTSAVILRLPYFFYRRIPAGVRKRLTGKKDQKNDNLYEMDIHIDAMIDEVHVQQLIKGELNADNDKRILEVSVKSYRVERIDNVSALHKIYAGVTISLPEGADKKPRPPMEAYLIYEVYFHRPSNDDSYILKDLRFISSYAGTLDAKSISSLKMLVVDRFINPLLREKDWFHTNKGMDIDSLFTMSLIEDKSTAGVSSPPANQMDGQPDNQPASQLGNQTAGQPATRSA